MLYTLEHARDNIRNKDGKRVFYLGASDQLTSEAKDYLLRQRIEILPASQARPDAYRLLSGGCLTVKPEHMTHLNGDVLVLKTHPRIAFRGAVDNLEAQLLLCGHSAGGQLQKDLEEILALTRKLIRWDVLEEQAEHTRLCGMDEADLRQRSHRPQEFYGQPHFMPGFSDSSLLLQLNCARCAARQAELAAVHAFSDREGNPTRPDLLQVLNRLSSALYILMIREKAGKGTENG